MFPYIGGKAFHIRHLDNIFPIFGYDRFVDVFGGAGWVTVKSKRAARCERHYNDFNPHLANIYNWFRNDPEQVLQFLTTWPQQDPVLYRQYQQDIFAKHEPATTAETAAKYLYLEIQSFSGNTLGLNSSVYFDKIHKLDSIIRKLQNPKIVQSLKTIAGVHNKSFDQLIPELDSPSTYFYCDPPYYGLEHYYTQKFSVEQHETLAQTLKACQGGWAVSYYEFDRLESWYPRNQYSWHTYSVSKQSSSRRNKQRGQEVVITNA